MVIYLLFSHSAQGACGLWRRQTASNSVTFNLFYVLVLCFCLTKMFRLCIFLKSVNALLVKNRDAIFQLVNVIWGNISNI